jgi:hypothetical protein
MPPLPDRGCYVEISYIQMSLEENFSTKAISLEASLSTGIMNKTKKTERMANPLAVRVYEIRVSKQISLHME